MKIMRKDVIWRDVKGYEGRYKISNYGDVMSLLGGHRCTHINGFLKPQNMKGTWAVQLRKDNKGHSIAISHIVAQAFLYPSLDIDDFSIVRHIDEDLSNCHVDNLSVYFQRVDNKDADKLR